MTIDDTDAVDFLTLEHTDGDVVLTVSDHLDWIEDEGRHLMLVQGKLNSYLRFIESGEMVRKYPATLGRRVVINVSGKYKRSKNALTFYAKAQKPMLAANIVLRFTLHQPN